VVEDDSAEVVPDQFIAKVRSVLEKIGTDPARSADREKLEWATYAEVKRLLRILRDYAAAEASGDEAFETLMAEFRPSVDIPEWRDGHQFIKLTGA